MKIVCVGDSNTYGYDPCSRLGGRYDETSRWVDILGSATGWTVCNRGENGREIPTAAMAVPPDAALLILMLGTNDLLQGRSPEAAAERLEQFISGLQTERHQILLIAPPPMTFGEWVQDQRLIDNSRVFAQCCRTLAGRLGIRFADAGQWNIPLAYDGVHFTAQGHRAFAAGLLEAIG